MEVRGRLEAVNKVGGRTLFALSTDSGAAAAELEKLKDQDLRVKVVRYRKPRSLNANALMWHCIGEIANAIQVDTWTVYIDMLRNYGKFTFICVKPNMVESVKKQWRESLELGPVIVNGKEAVQMQVFFGSSTYDTAEMSRLIDGTISMMEALELPLPIPNEVKAALEEWETYGQHTSG